MRALRTQQKGVLFAGTYLIVLIAILSMTAYSANTAYLSIQKRKLEQTLESIAIAINDAGDGLTQSDYQFLINTYVNAAYPVSDRARVQISVQTPTTSSSNEVMRLSGRYKSRWFMSSFVKTVADGDMAISGRIVTKKVRQKLEVAVVLDVSSSMSSYMGLLRQSAKRFADILFNTRANDEQVYMSLVPFNSSVTLPSRYKRWIEGGYLCTSDYRFSGAKAARHILDYPKNSSFPYSGSAGFCGPKLMPLTNDTRVINRNIRALDANGGTAVDIGFAWGMRTLAPSWQSAWRINEKRPLSKGVKKVIVIFSDGQSFSNYSAFVKACRMIKTQEPKMTVYAVQFGSSVSSGLKSCAQENYYQAENPRKLSQAFEDIGNKVGQTIRLGL